MKLTRRGFLTGISAASASAIVGMPLPAGTPAPPPIPDPYGLMAGCFKDLAGTIPAKIGDRVALFVPEYGPALFQADPSKQPTLRFSEDHDLPFIDLDDTASLGAG